MAKGATPKGLCEAGGTVQGGQESQGLADNPIWENRHQGHALSRAAAADREGAQGIQPRVACAWPEEVRHLRTSG